MPKAPRVGHRKETRDGLGSAYAGSAGSYFNAFRLAGYEIAMFIEVHV